MRTVWKAVLLAGSSLLCLCEPSVASEVELRLVVPCMAGLVQYPSPFSDKRPICVSSDLIASDANIVQVTPAINKFTGGAVEFEFDHPTQARLAEITENNLGRQIAFMSQGRLMTAAMINSPIRGGKMELVLPDEARQAILKLFQDRKLVK